MKEDAFSENLTGFEFDELQDQDDFQVANVALPYELPQSLDLDAYPERVKRSSAVEALIQQNDDLMSRLTVALRRISDLEEDLHKHQNDGHQYKSRYENLRDQVLVLKEKIKILSERKATEESVVTNYQEQIQLLEIRYAELYESSQKKETKLMDQLANARKGLGRLERYRNRIKWATQDLRQTSKRQNSELGTLKNQLEKSEITAETLRQNILESTDYIRQQSKDHEEQIRNLTTSHEVELSALKEELQLLKSQNAVLTAKHEEYEATLETNTRLENELVLRDRKFEDYRIQSATELADAQKALARYRNESKELAFELDGLKADFKEKTQLTAEVREENHRLLEQVENLQALWKDQNVRVEKLQTQNLSLQKLNQELSMTINQYRKEIRDLREIVDKSHIESKSIVAPLVEEPTAKNPEILDKINQALADLQTSR